MSHTKLVRIKGLGKMREEAGKKGKGYNARQQRRISVDLSRLYATISLMNLGRLILFHRPSDKKVSARASRRE